MKTCSADKAFYSKIQQVPSEKRFLVTSHDAFNYFSKRYLEDPEGEKWGNRFRSPEGLAPDGQMSLIDIQKVSDFLCEHQIEVVFPEQGR